VHFPLLLSACATGSRERLHYTSICVAFMLYLEMAMAMIIRHAIMGGSHRFCDE
jgi:hypothetical protein